LLNRGKTLDPDSKLAKAIGSYTSGTVSRTPAALRDALAEAPANAPQLYRGMVFEQSGAGWDASTADGFIAKLQPGATVKLDASGGLTSWSSSPKVGREFAGLTAAGKIPRGRVETPVLNDIVPGDRRVLFTLKPGAKALNLEPHASQGWRYQKEWVVPSRVTVKSVRHQGSLTLVEVQQ
jgi:hypothetical protein